LPAGDEEAFARICMQLRDFELRTLMVASAAPRDGRTTVAHHLATAAARMGWVALLLEADFRHPTLAGQLDLQPWVGLSDVLRGELSLWSATQLVDLDPARAHASAGQMRMGEPVLYALTAGAPLPPNPGELIESPAMAAVLEQAHSSYDLVVIDTPALGDFSDAFPLLTQVDGVIIVGRVGSGRREVAEHLHEVLEIAPVPLLGVLANGVKRRALRSGEPPYGYTDAAAARTPVVGESGVSGNGASVPRDAPATASES
jgi:capsular exopolysaccharide synthesis family protein